MTGKGRPSRGVMPAWHTMIHAIDTRKKGHGKLGSPVLHDDALSGIIKLVAGVSPKSVSLDLAEELLEIIHYSS